MIRDPGEATAAVVTAPVSLVSLTPTLLDLDRHRSDPTITCSGAWRFTDSSLTPLMDGERADENPLLFAEVDYLPDRKSGAHRAQAERSLGRDSS